MNINRKDSRKIPGETVRETGGNRAVYTVVRTMDTRNGRLQIYCGSTVSRHTAFSTAADVLNEIMDEEKGNGAQCEFTPCFGGSPPEGLDHDEFPAGSSVWTVRSPYGIKAVCVIETMRE